MFDPCSAYARPSLVGDLLTIPALDANHQLENQATSVLAWLIDYSPILADTVLDLFVGAERARGAVSARDQVMLPKPRFASMPLSSSCSSRSR
jgi:hypothetical protein